MSSTFLVGHPKAVSIVGGLIFGALLLTVGMRGDPIDPVAVVLAALLGGVFAGGMYGAFRLTRRRPD